MGERLGLTAMAAEPLAKDAVTPVQPVSKDTLEQIKEPTDWLKIGAAFTSITLSSPCRSPDARSSTLRSWAPPS